MLAAAAYNFKRAMKVFRLLLKTIIETLLAKDFLPEYTF
jgi:hypothetical protein